MAFVEVSNSSKVVSRVPRARYDRILVAHPEYCAFAEANDLMVVGTGHDTSAFFFRDYMVSSVG